MFADVAGRDSDPEVAPAFIEFSCSLLNLAEGMTYLPHWTCRRKNCCMAMFQFAEIGHFMDHPYFRKPIKIEITVHETVMAGPLDRLDRSSPYQNDASPPNYQTFSRFKSSI